MKKPVKARRAKKTETVDLYQKVTDRIVQALEKGVAPWKKPWRTTQKYAAAGPLPVNASTGRAYSGVNAIKNPDQTAAFSKWMEQAKYGWLMWRLAVYGSLTWGFVKILHAPGFRSQYRQPLMRIAAVSVVFAVVCELVLLSGTGAS